MTKMVELNKCPNCGGTLEKKSGNLFVCPFCNSEFMAEEDSSKSAKKSSGGKGVTGNEFSKTEWFDYQVEYKELLKGKNSKDAMSTFVYCVNELGKSDEILKYIKTKLMRDSNFSLPGSNDKYLNAFLKRVRQYLDRDEEAILYANSAIFSNGKNGILVTNKRILVSGLKTWQVPYEEVYSIRLDMEDDTPFILINNSHKLPSLCNGEYKPHGAIMALISAMMFEKDPGRNKIVIVGAEPDDDYDDDDYDDDDDFDDED